ncbi:MAG TPA: winged helix DNA-binding domain-containing protein [Candidatus Limnocylindria bacterium]|nr:winged helix DNA-binding domain-containing protein [Candidatus Limnocylindria bacterium]
MLSPRRLNRAVLVRQLLLERADLPVTAAIERVAGLQTQYAPSGYIGLWSRLRDFERPMLTRALEERTVIQGTLLRVTIHTVSADDYWPMTEAVRAARREWWMRTLGRQTTPAQIRAATDLLRSALADGPVPWAELRRLLQERALPAVGIGVWINLVRVPPSGTWERRRADRYALADAWLPPSRQFTAGEGQALLVRRYLGAFGPARLADVAAWAGLNVATLQPIVEGVELRRFRDERGRELLDLPDAPLPPEETPAPVRFLGVWDPMLLASMRRAAILREEHRARINNAQQPQSMNTFLVHGQVAGAWRELKGGIELEPFVELSPADRVAVEEEAERLARFHA